MMGYAIWITKTNYRKRIDRGRRSNFVPFELLKCELLCHSITLHTVALNSAFIKLELTIDGKIGN